MNFMGIGMPEMLVIFVIAFLALGPSKSIDMARTAGRIMRDLRRTFNEVASAVTLDDDDSSSSNRPRPNNTPPPGAEPPTSNQP